MSFLKNKLLIFIFILLLAFLLRFYKLDSIPNGLKEDETSIGYNAYSILKTTRDEHNIFFPQNFKAFGEYKLPGYIYSSIIPIAIFGLNPFAIRFVSALAGSLTIFIVFFLSKELAKNFEKNRGEAEIISLLICFLLAINPFHIYYSRFASETNLANFFIVTGVYLFLKAVNTNKIIYSIFSIISFAFSIYTYNIARLFVPLLLLLLIYVYRKKFFSFSKNFYYANIVTCCIVALPFVFGAVTHGGFDSTLGTLIISSSKVQSQLQEFRSYFVSLPFVEKTFFNFYMLTFWQYIQNIMLHISPSYYFIKGADEMSTSFGNVGQWYIFEFLFVVFGIYTLLTNKNKTSYIILGWISLLILVSALTREPPQGTRTFFLTMPLTFCSGLGGYLLYKWIINKEKYIKIITYIIFSFLFIYSVAYYLFAYFIRFPIYYASSWQTGDRDVSLYIKSIEKKYDKIIIDKDAGLNYSELLTFLTYSPKQFQQEAIWNPEDSEGFTYPQKFGKFEIKTIQSTDFLLKNTLFITSAKKQIQSNIIKTIYYPTRPVVINIGQQIQRYPTTDPAFIISESLVR